MKKLLLSRFVLLGLTSAGAILPGCGWVDSSGRQGNESPGLNDLNQVVLEETDSTSLGVVDLDRNLATLNYQLLAQGGDLNSACVAAGGLLAEVSEADFAGNCDTAVAGDCHVATLEPELLSSELWLRDVPTLRRPVAQQYSVSLQDTDGATSEQLLTLCIASVSSAPVAVPDAYNVPYNQVRTVEGMVFDSACGPESASGVLSNDSDDFDYTEDDANNQQCLVAELVSPPSLHIGVFTLDSDGGFSYGAGPAVAVGATDSFTYRVFDGLNFSDTVTATISIAGENTAPVATNPTLTVNEGETLSVASSDLATDSGLGVISLVSVSDPVAVPALGSINWTASQVNYVANTGVFGGDSFDYIAADIGGATANGTVQVTVNALPTVLPEEGNSIAIDVGETQSLLFSVDDAEDAVTDLVVTVSSSDDSVVSVTHAEEFDIGTTGNWQVDFTGGSAGDEVVSVMVTDTSGGSNSAPVLIDVSVSALQADPVLGSPALAAVVGSPVVFNMVTDALATDADSDDSDLIFSAVPTAAGESFTLSGADKSFGFTPSAAGSLAVSVTIEDPDGNDVSGILTVEVSALQADPVLGSPALAAVVGSPVVFNMVTDALATDADSDDSDLIFSAVPTAAGESFTLSGADKSFGFTPSAAGSLAVSVMIEDPDGNDVSGVLTVEVSAGQADPVLGSPALAAVHGQQQSWAISSDSLATDADTDDTLLEFSGTPTSTGGSVSVDGTNKILSLIPNAAGIASINVTIVDTDANAVTGSLDVTVAANASPSAAVSALTKGTTGNPLTISKAELGVTDADSASAAVSFGSLVVLSSPATSNVTSADLVVDGSGEISFTPDSSGDYEVDFEILDEVNSPNFTFTVTVN